MTTVVALALSFMYTGLKGIHDLNEAIYAKKAILAAVENKLGMEANKLSAEEVSEIFTNNITQEVYNMKGKLLTQEEVEAKGYKGGMAENIDMGKEAKKPESERMIPLYTYKDGDKVFYILSVRGKGLWDAIWGNIALEKDMNTIAGVDFDHKAETPGLGAEIKDNTAWKKQFIGKSIVDAAGDIRGVSVMKGGAKDDVWQVDGISGATITADGVSEMLKRGLKYYSPVLNKMKKS
jgi:Na+-transporting NADH:ubiquinone oxidoreductase subunit C